MQHNGFSDEGILTRLRIGITTSKKKYIYIVELWPQPLKSAFLRPQTTSVKQEKIQKNQSTQFARYNCIFL